MASDFVIQSLLQEVPRSLRPVFLHWLPSARLPQRKEEQIAAYLLALRDPASRTHALERLSVSARALLAQCIANETRFPAGVILARTSALGFDVAPATLGELHYLGLAFFDSFAYWPGNANWSLEHALQTIVVPAPLADVTPPCERQPLHLPLCHARMPQNAEAASARVASLITDVLQAISDGLVRVTQENTFALRTQRVLTTLWSRHNSPSVPSPASIVAYLRSVGIVQQESSGALVPTPSFARERERPVSEQVAGLLEFLFSQLITRSDGLASFGFDPLAFAADCLRSALLALEHGTAVNLEECAHLVHTRASAMSRGGPGRRSWSWPAGAQPTPSLSEWQEITRQIFDTLYLPLGVVVECHECSHGPCFALTNFGHFWLHGENAPIHQHEHQQLIVQPDFTAILTHSGPWDRTAHVLRIFGTQRGDDNASVFHFTRERVQNATRSGHNVEELLELLETRATYPIPENVRVTLREWGTLTSQATLHRDANVIEFDHRTARDAFLQRHQGAALPVGERFALLCLSHEQALDVLQSLGASPVDYAQPPVAGIQILPDGTITSPAMHDLRIAALRDAMAVLTPSNPNRPEPRWRISAQRLRSCPEPALLFQKLMRLPGSPLPLPVRLQLLVLLRLVPRSPNDLYTVIDSLPQAAWSKLKQRLPWRSAILYDGSPHLAVVAPHARDTVRTACTKLNVPLQDISLNPPPFVTIDEHV